MPIKINLLYENNFIILIKSVSFKADLYSL